MPINFFKPDIVLLILGGEMPENYRNRKGFFSINVQTISDANLKILDIVASHPGSTHDSMIFRGSAIKARLELAEWGGIIVADSGYPNTR